MTRDDLIKEIERLADEWSVEVEILKRNWLGMAADNLQFRVDYLRALARRAKRDEVR